MVVSYPVCRLSVVGYKIWRKLAHLLIINALVFDGEAHGHVGHFDVMITLTLTSPVSFLLDGSHHYHSQNMSHEIKCKLLLLTLKRCMETWHWLCLNGKKVSDKLKQITDREKVQREGNKQDVMPVLLGEYEWRKEKLLKWTLFDHLRGTWN